MRPTRTLATGLSPLDVRELVFYFAIPATATLNADAVIFQYSSSSKVSQSHGDIVQEARPSSS